MLVRVQRYASDGRMRYVDYLTSLTVVGLTIARAVSVFS